MRTLRTTSLLVVVLVMGCTADTLTDPQLNVVAHGRNVLVTGQDDPALDVPAVQFAVDNYDRVVLRGTFNFGEPVHIGPGWQNWDYSACQKVVISRPVELVGKMSSPNGGGGAPTEWTTVRGGLEPITIENGTTGKVTVSEIHFDGPARMAILYLKGQSLEVNRVKVANVAPDGVYQALGAPPTWYFGHLGIAALERIPGDITGSIDVHHSEVDLSAWPAFYSRAVITLYGLADVTVSHNQIRNTNGSNTIGVETYWGSRTVTMERNHVVAGRTLLMALGSQGPTYVEHNTGEVGVSEGPVPALLDVGAVMVSSASDDAGTIANNNFHLGGGVVQGILAVDYMGWAYTKGLIENNKLTGQLAASEAGGAVLLRNAHENVLRGNELDVANAHDGSPALGYVLFASNNNELRVRAEDTVLDLGADNEIVWLGHGRSPS